MSLHLRPYQAQGVADLRMAFRAGHGAVLYVLSTGGGKTFVFSYLASRIARRGRRVLILVHRQELLDQAHRALNFIGLDHGLIAAGAPETHARVQIASVMTAVRRMERITPPDILIIDEAHHSLAGSWRKIIEAFPDARLLGVTATPARLDGRGLGRTHGGIFDTLVEGPAITDLMAMGFLSRAEVYAPPTEVDFSGIKSQAGDFARDELARRMNRRVVTGSAVDHYRKLGQSMPAIAFCVSVAHAKAVADEFRAAGIPAASIDGKLGDEDRRSRIDGLTDGRIKVLTSCDIVSEGTDIPVVGVAILLRPTQSLTLYMQQVGRVLRPYPGKRAAIILDHAGNAFRHGLPDEPRRWSLAGSRDGAGRSAELTDIRLTQCPGCYAVYKARPACPVCGLVRAPKPQKPKHADGHLRKLEREDLDRTRKELRRVQRTEEGRCRSLDDWLRLAKARGYKVGWAHYRWQIRQRRKRRVA